MAYVLPNRKAFADQITRTFLKYRKIDKDPLDEADTEADLCARQGDMSKGTGGLFPYQALVRDYLVIESPYRGLLLYHGLGSGKTCSSIAVAESLLSNKKIIVMLPASLQDNYRGEIMKCGDPIYRRENYWEERQIRSDADRDTARKMGISEAFLDREFRFFVNVPGKEPNFKDIGKAAQDLILAQIQDVLNQRFTFINYNGLTKENADRLLAEGNPFEDTIVIIDEAHNLISRVANESKIQTPVYEALLKCKTAKVVALSGTPIINKPREVALMMNLLRGSIERLTIPLKTSGTWDEVKMTNVFRNIPEIDTIEFNAVKKAVLLTRNPPHFRSVYNTKGDRTSVQYVKELAWVADPLAWVQTLKARLLQDMPEVEVEVERVLVEEFECLPSKPDEFTEMFLDGLQVKNPILFQRRIQGLVSYFKGADERMLPKRIEDDKMLEKVVMSNEQLGQYLKTRFEEIQRDAKRRTMNDDASTYRVGTRLVSDFTIPGELRDASAMVDGNEDEVADKKDILQRLQAQADKYLSEEALARWSPKMLRMIRNLKDSVGGDARRSQFVYSQYRSVEGLGVFSAILEHNGFQRYRLVKEGGNWRESPAMDDRPAYAFYTGEEDREEREFMRLIFNGSYDALPGTLKDSVKARGKKILCVIMASSAGAEGITLTNVRHVHIMEPHWNPARHDQVIGRAIRICSHATLPVAERTVRISFYLSVLPESALTSVDNNLVFIRRNDMQLKRYEGDPPKDTFMSTDEYLYETSFEKGEISKRFSVLLKQAAVDCEIHRKLHLKNEPQMMCMRFDSGVDGESLAFKPDIKSEERDASYVRNKTRRARTLQRVQIKGCLMLLDPVSREIYDAGAFEDNRRLLKLGERIAEGQIQWITASPCA